MTGTRICSVAEKTFVDDSQPFPPFFVFNHLRSSFNGRTDPDRDYTYYDLTKDADHVLTGTNRRARQSFSRVKHYPPNRIEDLRRKKRKLEERISRSRSIFNSTGIPVKTFKLDGSQRGLGSPNSFRKLLSRGASGIMSSSTRMFLKQMDEEEET